MDNQDIQLSDLPYDALLCIIEFCDIQSLGRLASTCRKLNNLISSVDLVWRTNSRNVFGSNMSSPVMQKRCKPMLSYKERVKLGPVWRERLGYVKPVINYRKCMPWTALEKEFLYYSKGNIVCKFPRDEDGEIFNKNYKQSGIFKDDIAKFAITENEIVCGGRDSILTRLDKDNLQCIHSINGHSRDILTVDAKKDIIVSGSKDTYVKVWKCSSSETMCKFETSIKNRVLSTKIMPSNIHFVVGSPGTKHVHPLKLFDLNTGKPVLNLGAVYIYGGGILDLFPESSNTFYSCGYDTNIQLWDIRCPDKSVLIWTEPFDNTFCSIRTDYNVTIVSSTSADANICLWDKRKDKVLRTYFLGERNASEKPTYHYHKGQIYSLEFDSSHVFVALPKELLQFSLLKWLNKHLSPS